MKFIYLLLIISIISCKQNNATDATGETQTTSKESIVQPVEQATITGNVINYEGDKGPINILGFYVQPENTGSVDDRGKFTFQLPPSFNKISSNKFEEYNKSDSAEYELELSNAAELFLPHDSLKTQGLDSQISLAGKFYTFEVAQDDVDDQVLIAPASSAAFIKNEIQAIPQTQTGWLSYYIYTNNPVLIKGEYQQDNLVEDYSTSIFTTNYKYDINLLKGWNLITYSVQEVVKVDNTARPSLVTYTSTSVNNSPVDWIQIN
ncbi:hypothetical protein [Nonlabens tegetincola]|uniref:hypothetical protein n=1 Tax=Nonlabens tegetincola TaxID=323273 RepID=UPI000CF54208|nr:hypothetical protein [Nonlabens tegetincola]PQJ18537.1 hypothetical protein BST93_08610 [Nonlabens tegetincola]